MCKSVVSKCTVAYQATTVIDHQYKFQKRSGYFAATQPTRNIKQNLSRINVESEKWLKVCSTLKLKMNVVQDMLASSL